MLKKAFKATAVAAAIVMATLGLTAAPANAAPTGTLTLHTEANFLGAAAIITEDGIATTCTDVPFGTVVGAKSGTLDVTGTQTIKEVQVFSDANCGTLEASMIPGSTTDPAVRANFGLDAARQPVKVVAYKGILNP